MDKKALAPWVLPVAGATTAVGAGLLGGINIDDWESMEPKEKAKKLLKCLVMGGVVGLGAEGVRQGYNQIKERALEKPASYKNSLLSTMLKRALAEENNISNENNTSTKKQTDLPEEASWGENTILGIPSHLAIGGGLGLAGGLTLYHFLTDKKKKKPTGYIGAGLGGLLTGVLGAGLFKGWSADEKNVKSDLYRPKEKANTTTPNVYYPALLPKTNYFVGAPDIKCTPEQLEKIYNLDWWYLKNGGRNTPTGTTQAQRENEIIDAYRKAVPQLNYENIIAHLQSLRQLDNEYGDDLVATEDVLKENQKYTDDDIASKKSNIANIQNLYNKPADYNILSYINDPAVASWTQKQAGPLITNIIKHYYKDANIPTKANPLVWALHNKGTLNNAEMWNDINRLSGNLGKIYAYTNGLSTPAGNTLVYSKEQRDPLIAGWNSDNDSLKYKYMSDEDFAKYILDQQREANKIYIPQDYSPNNIQELASQLRQLWANPTGTSEEFNSQSNNILQNINAAIHNSNGLPRSVFNVNNKIADNNQLQVLSIVNNSHVPTIKGLQNAGYNLNNLEWKPSTIPNTIAYANIGNGLALVHTGNSIELVRNLDSEYESTPRAELNNTSLNSLKSRFDYSGNGMIYRQNNGKDIYRDFKNGKLFITDSPTEYVTVGKKLGLIPQNVEIADTTYENNYKVCTLSDGSVLKIDLTTGNYSYSPVLSN